MPFFHDSHGAFEWFGHGFNQDSAVGVGLPFVGAPLAAPVEQGSTVLFINETVVFQATGAASKFPYDGWGPEAGLTNAGAGG